MEGGRSASGTTAVSPGSVLADGTPLNREGTVAAPGWITYAGPGAAAGPAMSMASATSSADRTGNPAAVNWSRMRSMIAVSAKPGQIAEMVIPSRLSRGAIDRAKAIAPPLATL